MLKFNSDLPNTLLEATPVIVLSGIGVYYVFKAAGSIIRPVTEYYML